MSLAVARRLADAVLYEGYVLYPYRASAGKNQLRWQVGLVAPREFADAVRSDPWSMQTECVAEAGRDARVHVTMRCLHVQQRIVEVPVADGVGGWQSVPVATVDGRQLIAWDEAVECQFVCDVALGTPSCGWQAWTMDGCEAVEIVPDRQGPAAARIVRRRHPLHARVLVGIERHGAFVKVRVRVENHTPSAARVLADRDDALRQSLAGTHTLLHIDGGRFVSPLDPPAAAAALAASCANEGTWPVLVGVPPAGDVMLSSPIILPDYPAVAPESPGDSCDATEIDELLMLRVRTLTDAEKREARATDVRAADIVMRADAASPELLGSLHGTIRHFADVPVSDRPVQASSDTELDGWAAFLNPPDEPRPEEASLEVGSSRLSRGSRVRLEPTRRADTMDLCLAGRTAVVSGVFRTLEGQAYVAVTPEDDPLAGADHFHRRALFFHPDELVPLDDTPGGPR